MGRVWDSWPNFIFKDYLQISWLIIKSDGTQSNQRNGAITVKGHILFKLAYCQSTRLYLYLYFQWLVSGFILCFYNKCTKVMHLTEHITHLESVQILSILPSVLKHRITKELLGEAEIICMLFLGKP